MDIRRSQSGTTDSIKPSRKKNGTHSSGRRKSNISVDKGSIRSILINKNKMRFFTESNLATNGRQLVLFVALGKATVVRFILSSPNLAWGVVLVVRKPRWLHPEGVSAEGTEIRITSIQFQ